MKKGHSATKEFAKRTGQNAFHPRGRLTAGRKINERSKTHLQVLRRREEEENRKKLNRPSGEGDSTLCGRTNRLLPRDQPAGSVGGAYLLLSGRRRQRKTGSKQNAGCSGLAVGPRGGSACQADHCVKEGGRGAW